MKLYRLLIFLTIASSFLIISACGGGGSTGFGELAVHITDAKPLLPEGAENVTNLFLNITGVSVHKSGSGWISLPLVEGPPHTIDLLRSVNGNTTEIVPPVLLKYGKYTQIRLEIESATIKFDNVVESDVVIPPDHFKTEKYFLFDVNHSGPIDIVIDIDLSQSLEVIDTFSTPLYILNPVLHIFDASETYMITYIVDDQAFNNYSTDSASNTVS